MQHLSYKPFVWTMTIFVALVYIVCALALALAPNATFAIFDQWFHGLDLQQIATTPTFGDTVPGFFTSLIATILGSSLFVGLWNPFAKAEVNP